MNGGVHGSLYWSKEYEDTIDRWHIDTEKQTETVEAAEGVEAPESENRSRSTTN